MSLCNVVFLVFLTVAKPTSNGCRTNPLDEVVAQRQQTIMQTLALRVIFHIQAASTGAGAGAPSSSSAVGAAGSLQHPLGVVCTCVRTGWSLMSSLFCVGEEVG